MTERITYAPFAGPAIACTISDDYLYVISNAEQHRAANKAGGCLTVYSLKSPGTPVPVSIFEGLGNARQLIVDDGVAYVSAREDGLWIIDVSNPETPKLFFHYDPIEYATGIALDGKFLYVACRTFGVEVVDVSDPAAPAHMAILRTGEAQSITVRNGIVFSGVWGSMQVCIHDVSDLSDPKELCRVPLQGRGDGVCVSGNLLLAATGQHRRTASGLASSPMQKTLEGFGVGWGFEIYDITNVSAPWRISRIDLPIKCYYPSYDMWSVQIRGNYVFVNLTYLGLLVYDIEEPAQPRLIHRYVFPISRDSTFWFDMMKPEKRAYREIEVEFDIEKEIYSPVSCVALAKRKAYVVTGYSGIYALEIEEAIASRLVHSEKLPTNGMPSPYQVHAVRTMNDILYAACGNGGLRMFRESDGALIGDIKQKGSVNDVEVTDTLVLLAENTAGLHILDRRSLTELSVYTDPKYRNIDEVRLSPDGRFALISVGYDTFRFIDITDPAMPRMVLEDKSTSGLYCRQIMNGAYQNKYMAVFWNARQVHYYDVSGKVPMLVPWQQNAPGFANGLCGGPTICVCTHHGGWELFDPSCTQSFTPESCRRIPGIHVEGKPFLSKDERVLYVSGRVNGRIYRIDLENDMVDVEYVGGSPDKMQEGSKGIVWALGYAGIAHPFTIN